jgi:class 3 adenylate cyclase
MRRLASFSRLIMFDKRGTGLSDPVGAAPTFEERMDDIRALMDAVGSERHDASVRAQLEMFRGREVKHTGDGFMASFDGPGRAIRCASAVVEEAHELGLEIRAGLHAGECELRGDDLGGIAVHVAARVGALAPPGGVLVSATVRDLVMGSGFELADRGVHELKGVPGEWRLFALGGSGA